MKIVVPGGSGQIGRFLCSALRAAGHEVVVLTRAAAGSKGDPGHRLVHWDGRTLGPWAAELDGADVVINLAGRSVDCRYNAANLREMMDSRVESTRIVGRAIAEAERPPRVWLQMSTATIYAHTFGAPHDEADGVLGGSEPDAPDYWRFSIDIAEAWERELNAADTPATRKVALRTAMVMSTERGGAFPPFSRLARLGLGGAIIGGRQFMSWIHERDFVRAIEFLIERDDLEGVFNIAAPKPLPHAEFMQSLRREWRMPIGLPSSRWMMEVGAFFLRTDTELLFKSRRVVPGRLLEAGFEFDFEHWSDAARDLVGRQRSGEDSTVRLAAAS